MVYTCSDFLDICKEYIENAPTYENGLQFVQSGVDDKDVDCIVKRLDKYRKNYDGISFLLVDSDTESKGYIEKRKVYTKKPGRPKTIVKGKKCVRHVHGLIINESKNTDMKEIKHDLTEYCRNRRKKKHNLKRQQISEVNGLFIIKYDDRQANHTYQRGDFDFEYFRDEIYFKPYE